MKEIIRDAPFGQFLRYVTRNRVLKYPEEVPGFKCPEAYDKTSGEEKKSHTLTYADLEVFEKIRLSHDSDSITTSTPKRVAPSAVRGTNTLLLEQASSSHEEAKKIAPTKTKDGMTCVDW